MIMATNPITNPTKELPFAVFGPVCAVRAMPSREVTVISIEAPEEMHVAITNLLYGKDAFISVPASTTYGTLHYGVLGETSAGEISGSGQTTEKFIHGNVIGVKAIRSRGVSVIAIEVPEDAHIEVTQMLYGRDVLIVPVALGVKTPYGIVQEPGTSIHKTNRLAGSLQRRLEENAPPKIANKVIYPTRFGGISRMVTLGGNHSIDPVRWAGIHCNNPDLWDFLGAENESECIEKLRSTCGISSRAELSTNKQANDIFFSQIYHPFITFLTKPRS